ncbi:MAG: T9SS type A sorting domain-containing protein [Saprospiraceae bacterium]|nr:T9SS type A sorting domain-containing protein [Saprospiraceae bacterium]
MKLFYLIALIMFEVLTLQAQNKIWEFDFLHDSINVRTQKAFQMKAAEVEIPSDGYVVVYIEGNANIAKGDAIVFAASYYEGWLSNGHGNSSATCNNDVQTDHHFKHRMVYKVEPGKRTFYALAHNWTDKNGTGLITVKGRMVIEFIPEITDGPVLTQLAVNGYPLPLTETQIAVDTFGISLKKSAKVLLTFVGRNYAFEDGNIIFGLKNIGQNKVLREQSTYHPWRKQYEHFAFYEILDLPAGEHQIELFARKTSGVMGNPNNAVYGYFYAQILDETAEELHHHQDVNIEVLEYQKKTLVGKSEINATSPGKALISFTGESQLRGNDSLVVQLILKKEKDVQEHTVVLKNTHPDSKTHHLILNKVFDLMPGESAVEINATFINGEGQSIPTTITGAFTTVIAYDAVTTPIEMESVPSNEWTIFPNPTNGPLKLKNHHPANAPTSLAIYNNEGRLIKNSRLINDQEDLSALPSGLYYLVLNNSTTTQTIPVYKTE